MKNFEKKMGDKVNNLYEDNIKLREKKYQYNLIKNWLNTML